MMRIPVTHAGEMGKSNWITYPYERVSGLESRPMAPDLPTILPPSRDRQAFPGAYAALDALDGAAIRSGGSGAGHEHEEPTAGPALSWYCTGPLAYDRAALDRDLGNRSLRARASLPANCGENRQKL